MRFLEKLFEFIIFQSIWKVIEKIMTSHLKFISDDFIFWLWSCGTIILAFYMISSYIKHPSKRFAFSITNKIFPKRHYVLSANMRSGCRGTNNGVDFLSWDLVAKVHINATKPMTIVFDRCTAELKHGQYKGYKK